MDSSDLESNFEPQTRARSNTWPLPRPEYFDKDEEKLSVPPTIQEQGDALEGADAQAPKKNSSRRNAWGNKSYADLITQAIQSSVDKRLTLSQIYEWMVQNVAYFKDKGDSNSSAGWKNSIRHNLSLHNRFMRVQNEGTGKSSWWMVNPEAKPGKAARRRAVSMETKAYQGSRGRLKKRMAAVKAAGSVGSLMNEAATPTSPSSSVSEGLDMFPESPLHSTAASFQLSPDFRPRASSNASSCSRLSPIPALDADLQDVTQVPPLSPIPCYPKSGLVFRSSPSGGGVTPVDCYNADQLVNSLAEAMKLEENSYLTAADCGQALKIGTVTAGAGPLSSDVITSNGARQLINGYSLNAANFLTFGRRVGADFFESAGGGVLASRGRNEDGSSSPVVVATVSMNPVPTNRASPSQLLENGGNSYINAMSSPQHSMSPGLEVIEGPQGLSGGVMVNGGLVHHPHGLTSTLGGHHSGLLSDYVSHHPFCGPVSLTSSLRRGVHVSGGHLGHHLSDSDQLLPTFDQDLDLSSLDPGGLECDVDQVIRHELSVDGNLDFNFEPVVTGMSVVTSTVPHSSSITVTSVTRPWVH